MTEVNSEAAKCIVSAGLERRREARQLAEQEGRLEQYEHDMIITCNKNCADAKVLRLTAETGRMNKERMDARRAARAKALAKEMEREQAAADTLKNYGVACLAIFCITIFTQLPIWAAATLALGSGVFPAVYIFRLYYPLED